MEEDKEAYAKKLAANAAAAVKIMAVLACVIIGVAAALAVFALAARLSGMDKNISVIVVAVFAACIVVLLFVLFGLMFYAKFNLKKLKKLD